LNLVTDIAAARHEHSRRRGRAGLSVALATAGPGARVAAILAHVREVADEIVVALDDRAAPEVGRALAVVADRVISYPYADPVDRPVPWLVEECRHEWVLLLDDDQIPSAALVEVLPELVAASGPTHYWLAQRWLYPDASSYIDEAPWNTDYQLRLLHRDPRFVRFSDEFHRPVVAAGPGVYVPHPLWHADPLVLSQAERLAKARRYERARPGLRVAGRSMNFTFHVPELGKPTTAPLTDVERELVLRVLDAPRPEGKPRAELSSTTREAIDALWPAPGPECYRGRISVDQPPAKMVAGTQQQLDARIVNLGDTYWEWGEDGAPSIRVGARWRSLDGEPVGAEALRTVLPGPLAPGEWMALPVHVRAPSSPGRYRLELDLVHEHVQWFEVPLTFEVDVVRQRVVALARANDDDVLAFLEAAPDVEPLLLEPICSDVAPTGYRRVAGAGSYLLDDGPSRGLPLGLVATRRTLPLLRAARKVRRGVTPGRLNRGAEQLLAALAGCELLVVLPGEQPPLAREQYELWLTLRVARALGVRTAVHRDLARGARGKRPLQRAADVTFADLRELVG
jgi:hypothetical protein